MEVMDKLDKEIAHQGYIDELEKSYQDYMDEVCAAEQMVRKATCDDGRCCEFSYELGAKLVLLKRLDDINCNLHSLAAHGAY